MHIIGLTGSIATGKSTTAAMFRQLKVPVFDADACVHRLFSHDASLKKAIAAHFPDVVHKGVIDRKILAAKIFAAPKKKRWLEQLIHPRVRHAMCLFLRKNMAARKKVVVVDIPLLFEKGFAENCDTILVTYASSYVQRKRVLLRPGMSELLWRSIKKHQWPDVKKLSFADACCITGLGKAVAFRTIKRLLKGIITC